ncbi:DDE-type integrase/transposase/recombinase [Brevibacterium sp. 50QC2O2]|uniref:DDE-type integrase/transposase/recombinase n=2 Tax=Brevibacterium TaxID=1696 RepID=UPI00211C99F7|nr:DDE-type integrase/transposase/recombinase [Brevibacterium sp. 50QC2O2]
MQERIRTSWEAGHSVDHAFAAMWDDGVMLASRRSWWRIAAQIEDQSVRPVLPRAKQKRCRREAPQVMATRPGQAWSWDITDLYSPWVGKRFKAYKVIDVFSRKVVGHRVEECESDQVAVEMFTEAIGMYGAPEVVHADNGSAMTSNRLRELLAGYRVESSFNRPYVSNDNPFSEAAFKTMKYRPGYPRIFETVGDARAYVDGYVQWYNTVHRHSGIALFTPESVFDGSWQRCWHDRDQALQEYYRRHRGRFKSRPVTPKPPHVVGINLPEHEAVRN